MFKKNRRTKKAKKINIGEIKYLEKDLVSILKLIESYKVQSAKRKPNIRFGKVPAHFDTLEKLADDLLADIDEPVKATRIAGINMAFKKYYDIKNYYGKSFAYSKSLEKKLDTLIRYAAIVECGKVYEMRKSFSSPECFTIEPMLTNAVVYFTSGIKALVNVKTIDYELELLSHAITRRISSGSRAGYRRMFYIHVGKTNSGKTYTSLQMLKNAKKGTYLSPLRLLALEVWDNLNNDGVPCSLLTGEEELIVEGATHVSSTVELADLHTDYDVAVIDECQMISDYSRGYAWTKAITDIRAREVCLCTAPEAVDLLIKLIDSCGDFYEVISHRRKTPLEIEKEPFSMDDVQSGDALVAFSKQKVNAIGAQLMKRGIGVSVLYGALPYKVRKQQFENFISGRSQVLVTTDAIGMGVNLPIRRVVFMETYKFDGKVNRHLNSAEVKQIGGRAGRRGIFDTGYISALTRGELDFIEKKLHAKTTPASGICLNFPKTILAEEGITLAKVVKAWECLDVPGIYVKESLKETEKNMRSVAKVYKKLGIAKNLTEIYDMAAMPIDVRSYGIKELWLDYVEMRLSGYHELRKPFIRGRSIDDYLSYSKMLDTYFLCSKSWGMGIDYEWLERKRSECNEILISGLIKDIESRGRHCEVCGKELEWNREGNLCEDCEKI